MSQLKQAIQGANRLLEGVSDEIIEAHNEYVVWRHQLVGSENPGAQNYMSEDPDDFYWDTQDLVVPVKKEGPDDMGRHVFYCKVEPVYGDLFISKRGRPDTQAAVRSAPTTQIYRVVEFDVRRDDRGEIIYSKVYGEPDRSGKWGHPSD